MRLHYLIHIQEIHNVITSPFLRCLQTAQQICKVLSLPGLHTCNRIVDVLSSHCGIYEQPVVPNPGIAAQGVQIVELDTSKLPKYPERTREGIRRSVVGLTDLQNECIMFEKRYTAIFQK